MSLLNKNSFKVILISIMVLINIIGVIAVIVTVTNTVKELNENLKTGKINVNTESSETQEYSVDESNLPEGSDSDMNVEIDFVNILKILVQNRNTRLLLALVICGVILLLDTILILIKI